MDQAEDFGIRGVLQDGLQTRLVVMHVFLQLTTLDIEYINKNLYVSENVVPLAGEVVLHERVLSDVWRRAKSSVKQESLKTYHLSNVTTNKQSFTLHSPTGLGPDCQETAHGSAPRQLH